MIIVGTSIAAGGFAFVAAGVELVPLVILGALIVGCGQGLYGASLQASALEAVPPETTASGAGFFSTSRYVGSIAGSLMIAAADAHTAAAAQPVAIAALVGAILAIGAGARAGTSRSR